MCLYELWIYSKCQRSSSSGSKPHQTLYIVHACASARCDPDLDAVRTIRRDRHCPGCFEALRSTMGGCGEMCWHDGREWMWDERLHFGTALLDLVAADGSDAASGVALDGGSGVGVRTDSRFRAMARRWSGWEDFR
ncbi:hypothetical protein EDC01DRAFT_614720 [Geopyxis carbonaria]|nr:hypothetical protein EDC01DRAFT_614720 [Geopyxis carbonaria]